MSGITESNETLSLDDACNGPRDQEIVQTSQAWWQARRCIVTPERADFLVSAALAGNEKALQIVNAICDLGSEREVRQDSGDEPDLLLGDAEFMMWQQKQGGAAC